MLVCSSNATPSSQGSARRKRARDAFALGASSTTLLTILCCGSPATQESVNASSTGSSSASSTPTFAPGRSESAQATVTTGTRSTNTFVPTDQNTSQVADHSSSEATNTSVDSVAPIRTNPVNTDTTALETTTAPASSSGTSDAKEHEPDNHDHCVYGYEPELNDSSIAQGFAEYTENGQTDAILQPEIIAWMEKNEWQESHFQWHNVRRCGSGGFGGGQGGGFGGGGGSESAFNPCDIPALLPDANECANAQDGYEFLVMHRHMIQSLKQLFPSHTDQFEGWDQWPDASDYPELLQPYFNQWGQQVLQNAAILDNIEDHLDMFANEGELGMWFQCGGLSGGAAGSSLHGALHFNGYPQNNQSHSVANQRRNLDSFLFWKLHGYIDKIWERYRVAKGLQPNEEALQTELRAQCLEMDALAHHIPGGEETQVPEEIAEEEGFFHEVVRPGLEDFGCATCHGAGEDAGLRLGFNVSSKEIVARLVNVDSAYATGYKLVVPGDPDNSWLYLKAAGLSTTSGATCQGVMNCAQAMPPGGGMRLPDTDLANLRQWIEDGAPAPTEVP